MKNLIKANFYKLFKSKYFYVLIGVTLFLQFVQIPVLIISTRGQNIEFGSMDLHATLADFTNFNFFILLIVLMFFSAEFKNGAIRNKIVVGKTRQELYLANLITVTIISLSFLILTYAVNVLAYSLSFKSYFKIKIIINYFLLSVSANIFSITLFTIFGMVTGAKGKGTVAGILTFFGFSIIPAFLFVFASFSQTWRKLIEFVLYLFPSGQVYIIAINSISTTKALIFTLINFCFAALFTAAGFYGFKKVDIK